MHTSKWIHRHMQHMCTQARKLNLKINYMLVYTTWSTQQVKIIMIASAPHNHRQDQRWLNATVKTLKFSNLKLVTGLLCSRSQLRSHWNIMNSKYMCTTCAPNLLQKKKKTFIYIVCLHHMTLHKITINITAAYPWLRSHWYRVSTFKMECTH